MELENLSMEAENLETSGQETNKEVSPIQDNNTKNVKSSSSERKRLLKLPLSRIKHIMKMDPDCGLVRQDSVFLVTKATELFLECLGRESVKYTHATKRKTILRKDVDAAIDSISNLCFLDGALE